ncbi:MAG: 7-carboxy-7-deazaguanine synthase QueE [Bacteroidia bacterium]
MSFEVMTGFLPVMEAFYTIQGEGYYSGRPAYFVRLGGCDVGCSWCDVKESWDKDAHPLLPINKIVENALRTPSRFVVITGGEPAIYDLTDLVRLFKSEGFYVAIETSGAYPLRGEIDWICLSPKKFKAPLDEMIKRADELKVIINHPSDFEWAGKYAEMVKENCQLYLQPEYERFHRHIGPIIDYVKQRPEWRISLQTHKIINVP